MNQSEHSIQRLVNFLRLGLLLSLTYYIKQGISITNRVLVRAVILENDEHELVLANGALIPFNSVISIHYPVSQSQNSTVGQFSEQEISKFQLTNWTGI